MDLSGKSTFFGNLGMVAVAHFVALAALLLGSFVLGLFEPKRRIAIPVDIQFVAPPSMVKESRNDAPEPPKNADAVAQVKIIEKQPEQNKKKNETSKPRPKTNSVPTFANAPKGKQPPLSMEKIREMILAGARPGDVNIVPEDDDLQMRIFNRRFYDAWEQPAKMDVGNSTVEVLISLDPDGTVTKRSVVKRSGVSVMDLSVERAIASVRLIEGLKSSFIDRNREILIIFRVE